jgi:hypothetical protein
MAEGVGFVPKITIFLNQITQFLALFKHNLSLFRVTPSLPFTDTFTDSRFLKTPG